MKTNVLSRAETFMYTNARLLERHLFACLFGVGLSQNVIDALKAYQNPDGGFGHALEPDNRSAESQPIFVEFALYVLDMVNALADPRVQADLLLPACGFLQSVTTTEGGVPFSLSTANRYPHTPWWEAPEDPPASLNPTASITGLLLKAGVKHPWIEQASEFCWREISTNQKEGFHDLTPLITFLANTPDQPRAARELERIAAVARKPGVVELDPHAAGYAQMPLDWAPEPDSYLRPLFSDDTLRLHLAELAKRQQPDGGWPITWETVSKFAESEWRGRVTINALHTLIAYEKAGFVVN